MKQKRNNIVSIIFCGLLVVPLLFIALLQFWQLYLSNTAYERIEEEQVQTVIVESQRVVWKEEGREVTIDGEYFDLITWSINDGKYIFTGVFDKEETAVVNMLEKQTSTGIFISRLMIFFQCLVVIGFSAIRLSRIWLTPLKHTTYYSDHYKFFFKKIISPPPQFFPFCRKHF